MLPAPVQELVGMPVYVTIGFRSEEVNKVVNSVADSQHLRRFTADEIDCPTLLGKNVNFSYFDQCIWYREKDFIHVTVTDELHYPRKELLIRRNGKRLPRKSL